MPIVSSHIRVLSHEKFQCHQGLQGEDRWFYLTPTANVYLNTLILNKYPLRINNSQAYFLKIKTTQTTLPN